MIPDSDISKILHFLGGSFQERLIPSIVMQYLFCLNNIHQFIPMESKKDSPALKGLLAIGWSRHKEYNYSLNLYNSTVRLCKYKEQGNTIPQAWTFASLSRSLNTDTTGILALVILCCTGCWCTVRCLATPLTSRCQEHPPKEMSDQQAPHVTG